MPTPRRCAASAWLPPATIGRIAERPTRSRPATGRAAAWPLTCAAAWPHSLPVQPSGCPHAQPPRWLDIWYATTDELGIRYAANDKLDIRYATTNELDIRYATNGNIRYATNGKLDIRYATKLDVRYATTDELDIRYATNGKLDVRYAANDELDIRYATTDELDIRYATNGTAAQPHGCLPAQPPGRAPCLCSRLAARTRSHLATGPPPACAAAWPSAEPLGQPGRGAPAALGGRLAAATGDELDIRYATTAELDIRYATNGNIRYATNGKLDIRYATKLDVRYATTDELDIRYATNGKLDVRYATNGKLDIRYATNDELDNGCLATRACSRGIVLLAVWPTDSFGAMRAQ